MDLRDLLEMFPLFCGGGILLGVAVVAVELYYSWEKRNLALDRIHYENELLRLAAERAARNLPLVEAQFGPHHFPVARDLLASPGAAAQLAVNAIESTRKKPGDELRSLAYHQTAPPPAADEEARRFYEKYSDLRL